ncbi:hypothetical protein CF326_g304 [Tilletia indica]|nr:hypothetical protein CF326_g304 [Tilletia indica]
MPASNGTPAAASSNMPATGAAPGPSPPDAPGAGAGAGNGGGGGDPSVVATLPAASPSSPTESANTSYPVPSSAVAAPPAVAPTSPAQPAPAAQLPPASSAHHPPLPPPAASPSYATYEYQHHSHHPSSYPAQHYPPPPPPHHHSSHPAYPHHSPPQASYAHHYPTSSSSSSAAYHHPHHHPSHRVAQHQQRHHGEYEREYEYEYDPRARDYRRSGPVSAAHPHEYEREHEYDREYALAAAGHQEHPRERIQPSSRGLSASQQQEEYEYEYARARGIEDVDEAGHPYPASRSPRATHSQQYAQQHHSYPSRPPSAAPPLPHLTRGGPATGASTPSGAGIPSRTAQGGPSSAATTPSPRIQPSYFRGGPPGGPQPPQRPEAGGKHSASGSTVFSPPRLAPADSPHHGQAFPPPSAIGGQPTHTHRVSRSGSMSGPMYGGSGSGAGYPHHHPSHPEWVEGNGGAEGPKSSMSIMNMLNSGGAAAAAAGQLPPHPNDPASLPPPPLPRMASRREYDERERYRSYENEGEYDGAPVYLPPPSTYARMEEDRMYASPESTRYHRVEENHPGRGVQPLGAAPAAPSSISSVSAASTHQMREDLAAAALLSVAGSARVDPPSRGGPVPPPHHSHSYSHLRSHSNMSGRGMPSMGGLSGNGAPTRMESVEPSSSPVTVTSTPGMPIGGAPSTTSVPVAKKTLKLKSKPLPTSAAKVSYAVAPPPPIATPSEAASASGKEKEKVGKKGRGGKVKEEVPEGLPSSSLSANKDGWDSDLETEANIPQWTPALDRFVNSVHVRRAFLADAAALHTAARSEMSWERLSGAYGKRLAHVMEAVRRREEAEAETSAAQGGKKGEVGSSSDATPSSKKKGKGVAAGSRGGTAVVADEDVNAALLSTLADEEEEDDESGAAGVGEAQVDGEDADVDMLLAAEVEAAAAAAAGGASAVGSSASAVPPKTPGGSKKSGAAGASAKKGDSSVSGTAGASVDGGTSASAKKSKAPRKSRSKAAVAAEKAFKEAREHAIANGLPLPPTPPLIAAQARDKSKRDNNGGGGGAGERLSVPPGGASGHPSSPFAGSIAGLDESLANELLSTAVPGLGSDDDDLDDLSPLESEDEEEDREEEERVKEEDQDELAGSDAEGRSSLAAKRSKLAAAVMSSGKGKGKGKGKAAPTMPAPTPVPTSAGSKGSANKKRKRDIDVHDLSGSASRAGSAAIAAALAADGIGGSSSSRMHTPLRTMSNMDMTASPSLDFEEDGASGMLDDSDEALTEEELEEEEGEVMEVEEVQGPFNPNKPLGVNSAASHLLWTRENGLVALEPARLNKLEEAHRKVWTQIARRDVPRVYRTCQASYNNKIQYWKRISMMAQREGRKGTLRTQKTVKDVQARARRVVREMLTFWRKNEKEERELRKKAEKEAMDKAKKEEEMREAKRQARKLNFLITQTELYSHFVGSKLKTDEAEESEETSGGAATGTVKPGNMAGPSGSQAMVTASTSKETPLGPVDGATLTNIDFDDEDESNLRAHAARNAQQAVEDAKMKARAFDAQAAEERRKNEARLAAEDELLRAEGEGGEGSGSGKMIEEKDLGKAFDSDDMNFQNPTSMGAMDLKQPRMLTCQLKEYQLKGLNWLANLYEQGINGILADEMGLGKTVQSISLMAYLAEVHDIWGPFLVIAPASTLHNWQQEISRFVPTLKALPYWGSVKDRQVLRKFWNRKQIAYNRDSPFHVLVTSYQLVVSDEAHFRRVNWQYMVLDEAQAIKSSQSARWKTLLSFNCRNRLLLTGTPVQNSMQELWALLHFIMPSLFDSHDEFSEWFSKDIESHAENKGSSLNEHQLRRLHMILKPFMLRRIKKNVQNELGDKIEIDLYCEMSARQKMLYRTLRTAVSAQDIIEQATHNESGLKHLMNLVMQFRKVCNHPELFERADVSTPFAFAGSAQSGSIAREGDFLYLPDSTRSLIEMEVPKLFYEDGGFFDVPAIQSRAGFDTKYLDNLFSIWRADHIQRSLLQEPDSAFATLPLLNLSAGDAEHAYRNPTIERIVRAVEAERRWVEHEALAADDDFSAAALRPFGLVCKPIPKAHEGVGLDSGMLMPLNGVAADYRHYSVLAKPGARAIIPPAVAPPPEMVASSRTIYDRQKGYKHDALVSLALYGLANPEARESEQRVERARAVLPGLPVHGILADSSEDQLPASTMQIPRMNKFIVDSSKLARLDELLRELKQGGHRCLVYFQMTRMIDLMEEYLIYRQYKYLRLDGASKISDRRDMVTDWQTNPELFVFLLSTRAGGLGINLTAADTVIFYDHDWNPSNDSQAMDRAHRLGQTKQVTVYRLITKGTIDERIVKLARNKKEVQDIVVGNKAYTESGMAKPQEIVSLLLDDDELAESILRKKQAEEAQTAEQKADMMRALHAKRKLLREKGVKEASPAPVQDSLAWTLDEDEDDFFGAKPSAPKADDEEEAPEGTGTSTPVKKKKGASSGGGGNTTAGTKRKKPEPSGENGASGKAKARSKATKATNDAADESVATNGHQDAEADAAGDDDSIPQAGAPPKKRKKTDRRKKTMDEIALPPEDD